MFFGFSLHAASFSEICQKTKTFVQKRPAIIIATITLPIAAACLYCGIKASRENTDLWQHARETVPGLQELLKKLGEECSRRNEWGSSYVFQIDLADVRDFFIAKHDSALAIRMNHLNIRTGNFMIPGTFLSIFGLGSVLYACADYMDSEKK